MSKQNKDILEELFHAKLYNHEVDTLPGDWENIVNRLPKNEPVVVHNFRRHRLYWSAAAIALLLMATGVYFLTYDYQDTPVIVENLEKSTPETEKTQQPEDIISIQESVTETPLVAAATDIQTTMPPRQQASIGITRMIAATEIPDQPTTKVGKEENPVTTEERIDTEEKENIFQPETPEKVSQPVISDTYSSSTEVQPVSTRTAQSKPRRWGFGMGSGSLTASSSNAFNTLVQANSIFSQYEVKEDQTLLFLNTIADQVQEEYKTEFTHKTPVNVGLSASYYLTDRWSLQFGVSYSLLVSHLKQNATTHEDGTRKLHFIGIPISVAYRIAEWQRLQVYGSAGFMPELNVAGKYTTKKINDDPSSSASVIGDEEIWGTSTEKVRAKELFWSVNARAGVSYPVIRFVNAFAEVGAAYYFDNHSDIKTIHSEKPFNVSFNFGLRFGF